MSIWFVIGIVLIAWALYDIFKGSVWIHRKVDRKYEPKLYWFWITVYILIGISCLGPVRG